MNISPKKESSLFELFKRLEIEVVNHNHEPFFTVEDSKDAHDDISGAHTKNLFLKEKKSGKLWLIVMLHDQKLDLKIFRKEMGIKDSSFASSELLMQHLGVEPGSVTPFGLINTEPGNISVVLDKDMMEHNILNYHPLRNDMTTSIQKNDFIKFIEHLGHNYEIRTLPKV